MKELVVIIGSILLGCLIFDMIVGDGMSLRNASGEQMETFLKLYGE